MSHNKIRVIVAQELNGIPEFLEIQNELHFQDDPDWLCDKLKMHQDRGNIFLFPPRFVVIDLGQECMNAISTLCSRAPEIKAHAVLEE